MGLFSYIRDIYDLDTIDTRFTTSSNSSYQTVINSRLDSLTSSSKRDDSVPGVGVKTDLHGRPVAQPSRWSTVEFYFYYVVFLVVVPYMFWIAYDVSRPSDPNYHKFEPWLSPGWIPGRKIDISDAQYFIFRRNIPYLATLVIFHPIVRKGYNAIRPLPKQNGSPRPGNPSYISAAEGDARLNQRASFDFGFALVFLSALHGFSVFKILIILYMNYFMVTNIPRSYLPAATWIFNIALLFANELSDGYQFVKMASFFWPIEQGGTIFVWARWLDGYCGIMPRWHIGFNMTVLRLISFNLDYYWSLFQRGGSPLEKKQLDPSNLSERDRISIPAFERDYSFRNYTAYSIYAPLYIAGPIITFNDYISQLRYPAKSIENSRTIKYGIRFLLCLLAIEVLLHFDYCVAISKANPNWADYTPAQLSLLSYFNLHVLWLKLLLPWRLFRLWALVDGMDPPENMLRCLSNNPSTIQFWRGWHKSYNRWLIRYIYIPMGGSSSKTWVSTVKSALNYATCFTFVAMWHDISLNLLIWGWLVVFFMFPEVIAGYIFPARKWENNKTGYRVLCGIGGVANLMMMMIANLVGFAVGVDGLKSIIHGIFRDYSGMLFLIIAWLALFVGIQVMFEVRQSEYRKGIFLKC
ncbi:glycerol:H+ symporter-like protein [Amylocarpus encephaloides]|uniref:Glycerol:H+ symporter-like protein n=1 Tax=Amylocarpus encephaloides TaxID=45428 RepID=A0A9P8C758_9HELO|nr:glycerol:H+ symporter-like protein [Amylocarpus encephaloides]